MNLIFRLIRIILHALFRSKLSVQGESIVKFRVWPHDLDVNNHMTNSRYLAVMDLGRTDLIVRSGLGKIVWKNNWSPVLASTVIRWRKSLVLFQTFEVHTKLAGWDEKWFYLDQKVMRNNRVVAHALQKTVFVGREGSILATDIIQQYETKFGISVIGDIDGNISNSIKKWQESEDLMRQDIYEFEAVYNPSSQ